MTATALTPALELQIVATLRTKVACIVLAATAAVVTAVLSPLVIFGMIPVLSLVATPLLAGAIAGVSLAVGVPLGAHVARLLYPTPAESPPANGSLESVTKVELADALQTFRLPGESSTLGQRVAEAAIVLSHAPLSTGVMLLTASTALAGLPVALAAIPGPMALFAGLAVIFGALGRAVVARLPDVHDEARATPLSEPVLPPETDRATGTELLERIRGSSVYRGQLRFLYSLPETQRVNPDSTGANSIRNRLRRRYPLLDDAWLERAGLERGLTASQARALELILDDDDAGRSSDFILIGPPGSGRGTLANLLALCCALHREGAVFCVHAESPYRNVRARDDRESGRGRNTSEQYADWVAEDDQLRSNVVAAFSDRGDRLDPANAADIIFTDPKLLAEQLLANTTVDTIGRIERLRYVVVDHPERLSPIELLRLRATLARLRLASERIAHTIRFLVMVSPLDNDQALAKWLLNRNQVVPTLFDPWHERTTLAGWKPPLELLDRNAEQPTFARAELATELAGVISAAVVEADALHDQGRGKLHIGVVDTQPLLGPEARDAVFQQCVEALRRPGEINEFNVAVTFVATTDLAVDRERSFDLVVVLGVAANPSRLVTALRPTLRADGALLLISDGSPTDVAAFHQMASAGWQPAVPHIIRREYDAVDPLLLVPEQPEAVVAWELARLLSDFADAGIPLIRIGEVFPADIAPMLVEQWTAEGRVERFESFVESKDGLQITTLPFVAARPGMLQPAIFELPWGCCTRDVLRLRDTTANAEALLGKREITAFVDRERVFIDLFPSAVLPYAPNSVEIAGHSLFPDDPNNDASTRFRVLGELVLRQPTRTSSLEVDRRRPRFDVAVLSDGIRPGDASDAASTHRNEAESVPPRGTASDAWRSLLALTPNSGNAELLLGGIERLGGGRGSLGVGLAAWHVQVEEVLRDVVIAGSRLLEDPRFVRITQANRDVRQTHTRTYIATATSVFLNLASLHGSGDASVDVETHFAPGAAVRALARVLRLHLAERFLHFDDEYAIDVLATDARSFAQGNLEDAAEGPLWRILVRRRRAARERNPDDPVRARIASEWSGAMLPWIHRRLERCTCDDGCAACCAGLDAPTRGMLDELDVEQWRASDVVSRRAAYVLVCALLGRKPNWRAFEDRPVDEGPVDTPPVDDVLQNAVREVIGTRIGGYRDGAWHDIFGSEMPLSEMTDLVAPSNWISVEAIQKKMGGNYIGYYSSGGYGPDGGPGRVFVSEALRDPKELRHTILHEYVHNWQYKTPGRFHHKRLCRGEEVARYFKGNIVVEGHARWCEHVYRLSRGEGPVHRVDDRAHWDEYKTGFFLVHRIEQAFGRRGLFLWLRFASTYDRDNPEHTRYGAPPSSRDPRLPRFPFTVQEALRAWGLEDEALSGRFTHVDFGDDDLEDTERTPQDVPPAL